MPLTSDEARRLIEAAHKRAGEIGIRVCVAVVDEGGLLQALQRMDGAPPLSAQIAECKANGAALTLRDGAAMAQLHQERPAFFALMSGLTRVPAVPRRHPAVLPIPGSPATTRVRVHPRRPREAPRCGRVPPPADQHAATLR